jgi:hypothetical protein
MVLAEAWALVAWVQPSIFALAVVLEVRLVVMQS